MKYPRKFVFCLIYLLLYISCVSPTFESPMVKKGAQGWIGVAGGIRCFDYSVPDYYTMENTRGLFPNSGFCYGFNENIALTGALSYYWIEGLEDGIRPRIEYYPAVYLAPKFEITRNKSDVVLAVILGPAYPEIVKTRIMVGSKGVKNLILTFGTNLSFYAPHDFFINLGPAEGSGIVFYLGYQIPYFNNPQNLAVGLGYRFNSFIKH